MYVDTKPTAGCCNHLMKMMVLMLLMLLMMTMMMIIIVKNCDDDQHPRSKMYLCTQLKERGQSDQKDYNDDLEDFSVVEFDEDDRCLMSGATFDPRG